MFVKRWGRDVCLRGGVGREMFVKGEGWGDGRKKSEEKNEDV